MLGVTGSDIAGKRADAAKLANEAADDSARYAAIVGKAATSPLPDPRDASHSELLQRGRASMFARLNPLALAAGDRQTDQRHRSTSMTRGLTRAPTGALASATNMRTGRSRG